MQPSHFSGDDRIGDQALAYFRRAVFFEDMGFIFFLEKAQGCHDRTGRELPQRAQRGLAHIP